MFLLRTRGNAAHFLRGIFRFLDYFLLETGGNAVHFSGGICWGSLTAKIGGKCCPFFWRNVWGLLDFGFWLKAGGNAAHFSPGVFQSQSTRMLIATNGQHLAFF